MTYMQFVVFALVLLIPLIGQCDVNTDLIEAAKKGDIIRVKTSLDKGANVNTQDKDGATALMYAAEMGYTAIVQALLAKSPNVDMKDNKVGGTALMRAALNNHIAIIEALLDLYSALLA